MDVTLSDYELHQVKTSDGLELAVRHYQPASSDSESHEQRTLLIVHGLSEHAGRYDHVAKYFRQKDWNVIIPDQRGHGESSGPAVHAPRFESFCEDLQTIREHFELAPERLGVLGHSMGGLIATRDAQLHPESTSALVLFSPLLGLVKQPSPAIRLIGKIFSHLWPTYLFSTGFSSGMATSNPEAIKKREADPYVRNQISARLFFEIEQALTAAWREQAHISVPVKVMQAAEDHLVDATAAMNWYAQYNSITEHPSEATLVADQLHELLNETDWETRCAEAHAWLEQHVRNEQKPNESPKTQAG